MVQQSRSQRGNGPAASRNGVSKPNGQKAACERCRGQKLRCVWDADESQCRRCRTASVMCHVPLPKPMGRPSRQSRSASIQSPSHSQNDPVYDWNERIPTTVASADEDVIMAMDPTDALVYPLNFLNWFPDFGNPNDIFALPGSGATPAVSDLSANVGGHKPFNPEIDVTSPALTRSPGEGQPETNRGESEKDKGFTAGMGQENQAELLTQICKLNVGLFQHPLHAEKDKTGSKRGLASANISQPAEENGPLSTNLKLSDLCIGKLLELTYQLKDVVARIRSREDGTPQKIECLDQSTALMVLSCYTRLEILYSRTLEILHQVRNGERQLKDANMLMSELVIDGFPVNGCYDLQLNFLVYLFEQTHDRLRKCIGASSRAQLSKRT